MNDSNSTWFNTDATGISPEEQQKIDQTENQNGSFDWGSLFGFLGTTVENSDKLAGAFSNDYRDDQIRLAEMQYQNSFFGGSGQFGNFSNPYAPQRNNSRFIIIGVIALIVIIALVMMLKK